MKPEETRHIRAQINRLLADAVRHDAIAEELRAQAAAMEANMQKQS